jgi:benzodiazapine receptor
MNAQEYAFWYLLCFCSAMFGALFSNKGSRKFYYGLSRPALAPRPIVFMIVWTVLYTLQATAAALFQDKNNDGVWSLELTLFVIFLGVSSLYTIVFFRFHAIRLATIIVLGSLGLSVAVLCLYFDDYLLSGWLFLPTVVWLAFALYLSIAIWIRNYGLENPAQSVFAVTDEAFKIAPQTVAKITLPDIPSFYTPETHQAMTSSTRIVTRTRNGIVLTPI